MNFLLNLYSCLLETASPALPWLLARRMARGKEDPVRLGERRGEPGIPRPTGTLIWIHGASVGEAQSTLIVIEQLKRHFPEATILLTSGTVTSARYLANRLPGRVIHQYYPVDHPRWVEKFLTHWQPDFVLWMESELWPAMLCALQKRKVPVMLLNARMSPRSLERWAYIPNTARILLTTFTSILAQTESDAHSYRTLGAQNVCVSGNLKYASASLPFHERDLDALRAATNGRPLWLYASTHKGEEELACRLHQKLSAEIKNLLTIIVPRHPERRDDILASCQSSGLKMQLRDESKTLPAADTEIYIADTLGELGLFYRLSPVACVGRSFSDDGGGGHNPIEAAQLGCAVLHGPHVQNQQEIYRDMDQAHAALMITDEDHFFSTLRDFLTQPEHLQTLAQTGQAFTQTQHHVLDRVLENVLPAMARVLPQQAGAA